MTNKLRTSKSGHQENWTKEEVQAGFIYFFKLHARYPTAREIDVFEYLPSSRSIQRQFGGLVAIRQELIPESESNFTRGKPRSSAAKTATLRAQKYEEEFYDFLCSHFEPVSVHEHKIMRPGNIASDYFIYSDEKNGVIIDLFYAQDRRSLGGVINIKYKKYRYLPYKTIFLLIGNSEISIADIRSLLKQRIVQLPNHILVDNEVNFKSSTIYLLKRMSEYSKS